MPSKPRNSSTDKTETPSAWNSRPTGSVNRVILVGRLVATPELRTTGSGLSVTPVRIVTNDREKPEFHDVVLWRRHADFAAKYLDKGRQVYIEGRLQCRTWEAADGTKRRAVEVVADAFKALSPKPVVPPAV